MAPADARAAPQLPILLYHRFAPVSVDALTVSVPMFEAQLNNLRDHGYAQFADMQLVRAKQTLEKKLGGVVDMLAWPFGIYDDELVRHARQAGYVAGFTLERRAASATDDIMAMPRYLVTERDSGAAFARLLGKASCGRPD